MGETSALSEPQGPFLESGAAATEVEQEVAKALFDIEVSPSSEIKADVRDIYISGVKEMEVQRGPQFRKNATSIFLGHAMHGAFVDL